MQGEIKGIVVGVDTVATLAGTDGAGVEGASRSRAD